MTEQGKVKKETNVSGIFNGCSVPNHNYCCGQCVLRVISRVDVCCSHLLCRLYWQKMLALLIKKSKTG